MPCVPSRPQHPRHRPALLPLLPVQAGLLHQRQGPQRAQPAHDAAQRLCVRGAGDDQQQHFLC